MKKILEQGFFTGERALFHSSMLDIRDSVFCDGESPLKESSDIEISSSIFKWKYPLWYCKSIRVSDTVLLETARSGIWYTSGIEMKNCVIEAPKTFRRSSNITLSECNMPNAKESFWNCSDIKLSGVNAAGDYFAMGCDGVKADRLIIDGNYAFDGAKNIEISNSKLISKDAFWNSENVTVRNSVIIGEYLGWNSKNLTFIDCYIESNQGLCYIENLKIENTKLINTDLAFEFSSVDAEITSEIDSVKNPISGKIKAAKIRELIMEETMIDPSKTVIETEEKE